MIISKIERYIGPQSNRHMQRVTHKFEQGKFIQIGETFENQKLTFQEIIEKGKDYFKRSFKSFDKQEQPIKGSEFIEEVQGPEANLKKVRHFGVII